jgi:uncharacterized membrane protein YvlD (DUF360 family)
MNRNRRAARIIGGYVLVAVLVNVGANAIHPTLQMLSIPVTIAIGLIVLVVALSGASTA